MKKTTLLHGIVLLTIFTFSLYALNTSQTTEFFLLQGPPIITKEEVNQLPRFWSGTFGCKTGSYTYIYHEGIGALKLDGPDLSTYTSPLWNDVSENIQKLAPTEPKGDYYIDEVRCLTDKTKNQPKIITEAESAQFIQNNNVVFYTGAGISLAAGIDDLGRLMSLLGINPQESAVEYTAYVNEHESTILHNFVDFCNRAFTVEPTKAHYALADIAVFKKTQILTENFDFLHQRTGILPFCMDASLLRQKVSPLDLKTVDAVICIGLSHDDRGFLGWYKKHNPQGLIIAFDIGLPDYLGTEDFLVKGDAQETVKTVRDCLESMQ